LIDSVRVRGWYLEDDSIGCVCLPTLSQLLSVVYGSMLDKGGFIQELSDDYDLGFGGTRGRGRFKMAILKHGRWSVNGRSSMISRLHRQEATDLGLERHMEDPYLIATMIYALPRVAAWVDLHTFLVK
jgi:hypothetical protein